MLLRSQSSHRFDSHPLFLFCSFFHTFSSPNSFLRASSSFSHRFPIFLHLPVLLPLFKTFCRNVQPTVLRTFVSRSIQSNEHSLTAIYRFLYIFLHFLGKFPHPQSLIQIFEFPGLPQKEKYNFSRTF